MKARLAEWAGLLRPGDGFVLAAGLTVCVLSAVMLWRGGAPDKAVVRSGGKVVAELGLSRPQVVEVHGAMGVSRIEVQPGRARVAADPGPRQYCVRQGWLTQAGAVAICAPNHVSLTLVGRTSDYDSLNY